MDVIVGFLSAKVWPIARTSLKDMQLLIMDHSRFFREIEKRNGPCPSAWLFGMVPALLLTLLALPALKGAGINFSYDLVLLLGTMNWMILLMYGTCFGIAARIVGAPKVLSVVNCFFYVSIALSVIRVFEMPALGARIGAMVESCNAGEYGQAVTAAISKGKISSDANFMVFLVYCFLFMFLAYMLRRLYSFSWGKSLLAATLGMVFLIFLIINLQQPAVFAVVCGYASKGSL